MGVSVRVEAGRDMRRRSSAPCAISRGLLDYCPSNQGAPGLDSGLCGGCFFWGGIALLPQMSIGLVASEGERTVQLLQAEWFWALVQAVGLIVTLLLIYVQIRVQTASHVIQALSAVHARWTEEPMLRARLQVCSNYLSGDMKFDGVAEYIAELIEELGSYVHIKAVPADVLWDANSWYIEHYYCMFKAGVESVRQSFHDETLYTRAELLFEVMARHSRKRGALSLLRGEEDLRRFALSEVQLAGAFLHLQEHQPSLPADVPAFGPSFLQQGRG